MAKCDEGYRCEVCGEDVEGIADSDLYLRYVIGQVDLEILHTTPEKHIRCNPVLAQFVVHPEFETVMCDGDFDKRRLDIEFVRQQEQLVTRGWNRLRELADSSSMPITEYPLPEVIEKLKES